VVDSFVDDVRLLYSMGWQRTSLPMTRQQPQTYSRQRKVRRHDRQRIQLFLRSHPTMFNGFQNSPNIGLSRQDQAVREVGALQSVCAGNAGAKRLQVSAKVNNNNSNK